MSKVDTKELREKAKAKFAEARQFAIDHGMDSDDADPSQGDLDALNAILNDAKDLDQQYSKASGLEGVKTTIQERYDYYSKAVTGKGMGFHPIYQENGSPKSFGRQFIESDEYKALVESGALKQDRSRVSTNPVTFANDDLVDPGTGAAQDGLVLPQFLPGILPLNQRPLVVRDLFGDAPATSDIISYAAQATFESGADTVSKADSISTGDNTGRKPYSSISWERRTSPIETIATIMATTRQALADAGQIQSLIDTNGRLMLRIVEEDQILEGSGASPDLTGLLNTAGVQTLDMTGVAEERQLDSIRVARRLVKTGVSRLSADAIILNPVDSEAFDLMKDDNGLYRGGNPVGNFTYDQPLWGLRRVESEAVDEGTGIVGAFKAGATVYERQGITVYTTDSHSDFFAKNLIAILFEERIGFAVFWPSAFVVITFDNLNTTASGDVGVQSGV